MSKPTYTFLIACGGTGGHLFPGVAIATALQKRGHSARALISEKKVDATAMENHPQIPADSLPKLAAPPILSLRLFTFLNKLRGSIGKSMKLIREHQADAVLGMGGFTSLPAVIAAKILGKKIFLHDSNSLPGRATKMGARFADLIFLGFEDCSQHLCPPAKQEDIRIVGTPLRSSLQNEISREEALSTLQKLVPKKQQANSLSNSDKVTTLLIIGGSQGASGLNKMVSEALVALQSSSLKQQHQVIHLTGPDEAEKIRTGYEKSKIPHLVLPFCHEMGAAYALADLVIARSGASTLNELSYFSLPSILVPYPHAADDHQNLNAKIFTRAGAARLVPETQDNSENSRRLTKELEEIATQGSILTEMASHCAELSYPDSAEQICQLMETSIEETLNSSNPS